jgi:hypothetical protein
VGGSVETYLLVGFALSVVSTVAAVGLVAIIIVKLPADYFCSPASRAFLAGRHPLIRRTGLFLKNLLGAVLIAVGVVLSLPGIPGPGILTVLFGVMLIDFPDMRIVERRLIRRPMVLRSINRLRRRYGKPPLASPSSTKRPHAPRPTT